MRNKRLVIALTGAVLCGLLGVMLVARYLSSAQAFTKNLGNVVVARTEIQLGEKITAEHLMLAPIPNGSIPDGAFKKIDELVGRVAITPIGVREPITTLKLAPVGVGGGLPAVIPEGYRAMTVKVDDVVGISGFVMPGSYVDVVAVILPPSKQGVEERGPISKIVLQNIKVLASGAKIDSPENQREPTSVKAVTLQVTPEQAERLVLAANEGKLQLVMRNYGDSEESQTKGASKNSLLTGESYVAPPNNEPTSQALKPTTHIKKATEPPPKEPKPAAQQAPRNSVELIEGSKRREIDMP
ncbi:MAG TPA: Flp pilus assembly protein CpaB [Pyrinomonadaceae bacterium]|jgi:pilus assembly protein CpaB|nr:Flp pilus assembly protein CpaB [Pyrinomonadaceae bacterium]